MSVSLVTLCGSDTLRLRQEFVGSPMSLYDFYMYLKYIEYSAENLEFYIWCVFNFTFLLDPHV